MRISDWSSDVCSSDLPVRVVTVVGVRVQLDARVEIPADQQYLLFCPQHRVARGAEIVGGIDHDRMALRKGDGRAIPAWFEQRIAAHEQPLPDQSAAIRTAVQSTTRTGSVFVVDPEEEVGNAWGGEK